MLGWQGLGLGVRINLKPNCASPCTNVATPKCVCGSCGDLLCIRVHTFPYPGVSLYSVKGTRPSLANLLVQSMWNYMAESNPEKELGFSGCAVAKPALFPDPVFPFPVSVIIPFYPPPSSYHFSPHPAFAGLDPAHWKALDFLLVLLQHTTLCSVGMFFMSALRQSLAMECLICHQMPPKALDYHWF